MPTRLPTKLGVVNAAGLPVVSNFFPSQTVFFRPAAPARSPSFCALSSLLLLSVWLKPLSPLASFSSQLFSLPTSLLKEFFFQSAESFRVKVPSLNSFDELSEKSVPTVDFEAYASERPQ